MTVGEALAEQDLREVVAARGELVDDLLLRHQHLFFELVEAAGDVQQMHDGSPVAGGAGRGGRVAWC